MKRLRKNKFVVITISVIVICLVYFFVKNSIDNYIFKSNSDIVSEKDLEVSNLENNSIWNKKDDVNVSVNEGNNESLISEDEIDFILDESEVEENGNSISDAGSGDLKENNDGEKYENDESFKIYVYITGEVNVPGVVILDEGSRIVDAINAAGGTTSNADISKVNLVFVLDDGMKVNIPNKNDMKNNPNFEYITMNSGDGGRDDYLNKNVDDGSSSSKQDSGFKNYSVVNINTATQTELETLPGIGPSLALKIINYRKENGKFSSIDDIKNVSGIGDSKFESLKKYIVV